MASPFYKCFKSQLSALGMPAPDTIFGTVAAATATIGAITKAISVYGTDVTISEIIGAGIIEGSVAAGLSEVIAAVGAVSASFYVGACIGALIACTVDKLFFASVRVTPMPMSQAIVFLNERDIDLPDAVAELMLQNPEMLGVRPSENYKARMLYYAYSSDGSNSEFA